jgi:hypothetical protein
LELPVPTIEAQRQKIGKQLYVAAWIVEVAAASLGLSIAWIMLIAAQEELLQQNNNVLASGDNIRMIMAGLPFLVIALVELLKIPFAAACYFSATKLTKSIFGFSLFLISILTFDTFLIGLEQNSSVRLMAINQIKDKQANHKKELKGLEAEEKERNSKITKKDFEIEYKKNIDRLKKEQKDSIKDIDRLIKELKVPVNLANNNLKTDIQNKRKDIKAQENLIRNLEQEERSIQSRSEIDTKEEKKFKEDRNRKIKNAEESFTSERETKDKNLKRTINNIKELQLTKKEDCGFFSSFDCSPVIENLKKQKEIKTQLDAQLSISLAGQIKQFNKEYDQAIKENREKVLNQKKRDGESKNKNIKEAERRLSDLKNEHQKLINTLQDFDQNDLSKKAKNAIGKKNDEKDNKRIYYRQERGKLEFKRSEFNTFQKNKKNRLIEITNEKIKLTDKIIKLENKFDREARGNQFYRFAMIFISGVENPSDVTNQNISFIAKVWFISLAGITAWMGTLLAFASFVLCYGPSSSEADVANAKPSKLRRCFRLLLIETRKYIRKPRVREVEKIVEKIIELEKEVIIEKNVPKEVIKEISVEKIVIQEVIKEVPVDRVVIQDVPTEVIRKEVIHVPIASDDLTILDVKKIQSGISKDQREDSSNENLEKDEK